MEFRQMLCLCWSAGKLTEDITSKSLLGTHLGYCDNVIVVISSWNVQDVGKMLAIEFTVYDISDLEFWLARR